MSISFEVKGLAKIENALLNLTSSRQTSQLMEDIGREAVKMIQNRIRWEKESPDGARWKANLDGTSTLFKTGGLHDSIRFSAGVSSVSIGTDWAFARVHQRGMTIKSSKPMRFMSGGRWFRSSVVEIPAREFLGFSENNIRELDKVIEMSIQRWIPGGGF